MNTQLIVRFFRAALVGGALSLCSLASAQTAAPAAPPAKTDEAPPVTVLSPFEVHSERDHGYVATNTLAGSRLNGALADTPASISVMTKDFLNDIDATNISKAMEYATSGGNNIGTGDVGGTTGNGLIENDYNFMIRGYREIQVTRDFFPTFLDGDAFNLERIDISRGPNSILFGVGGAGGIVNFTPKRALVDRDVTQLTLRVASWDNERESLDLNRVLLGGKLAWRLNLMNQEADGYQDFVTDNQKRGALAVTWKPTDSTTVRVDAETGKLHQNRARPWLPFDLVSTWRDNGGYLFPYGTPQYPSAATGDDHYTQWNNFTGPIVLRTAGFITGTTPAFTDGPLQDKVLWTGGGSNRYYRTSYGTTPPGFNSSLNFPDGTLPRTLNISGPGSYVDKSYRTGGVTFEQKLAPDFYIQAIVNRSDLHEHNQMPMGFAQIALAKDVMTTLPSFNGDRSYNATGAQPGQGAGTLNFNTVVPNQYTGQYLALYTPGFNNYRFENTDYRVQATYHVDLGWGGAHDFLAFASRSEKVHAYQVFQEANIDPNRPDGPDSRYDDTPNFTVRASHINPFSATLSDRGVPDPWTHPLPTGPIWGDPGHSFKDGWINNYWEEDTSTINTLAIAAQSKFLKDTLITTLGLRRDVLKINNYDANFDNLGAALPPTASSTGIIDESATTYTVGAVYKLPVLSGVSVFANRSTNFQDQPGDVLFGDLGRQAPTGPIKGKGQDYGFKFDLLHHRVNASLAWFKVDESNVAAGFNGNIYDYTSAIWRTIANGGPVGSLSDTHKATGDDVRSQVSKGVEVEVTANLTDNWRLTFNATRSTNVISGLDTHVAAYLNANRSEWQSHSTLHYDVTQSPGSLGGNTIGDLVTGLDNLIAIDRQQEGQIETNLRKWNGNVFTAYRFDEGLPRGLTIGAGVNYRGPEVLGRNPATLQMYWGHSYYLVNGMIGYDFKWKKTGVKVQFNVENLCNNNDQQVLASAWNSTTNRLDNYYYYLLPRTFSLTTTFDF